jgi:CheY-like chemotaxis protein
MTPPEKIILVADDDLDDQEMLEEVFLKIEKDAFIHSVSSARETLEYLRNCMPETLPCLIILDYNMPDLTGAQLAEMISQNKLYQHIPILVWSTSNSAVYRQECKEKGAKQYFYKPHDFMEVIEMAKQMLSYCNEDSQKLRSA